MSQIELIEGTTRDHSRSQFFTPARLAEKLVQWAIGWGLQRKDNGPPLSMRVLEPSAGNGAIVRPLVAAGAEVCAIEIDDRYYTDLCSINAGNRVGVETGRSFLDMHEEDFWPLVTSNSFDLVVGNFPFHLDLDGAFTLHALKFAPRVCAIYPANVFYSETREKLWTQVRPTRVSHIAKRPWPGATDYVALELVKRERWESEREPQTCGCDVRVEWWYESWT